MRIATTFSEEVSEQIKSMAASEGRSLANTVAIIVKSALEGQQTHTMPGLNPTLTRELETKPEQDWIFIYKVGQFTHLRVGRIVESTSTMLHAQDHSGRRYRMLKENLAGWEKYIAESAVQTFRELSDVGSVCDSSIPYFVRKALFSEPSD